MRVVAFQRGVLTPSRGGQAGEADNAENAEKISVALREYCTINGHKLVELFAPETGYWDDHTLAENYRQMLALFQPPHGRPALVLIPDATHLAGSLDVLVERLVALERLDCQVRCMDADLPDPLQNGEANLGLEGEGSSVARVKIREALLASASRGSVLGRTPYGYRKGTLGKFEIDPAEAQIVRSIFALYTSRTAPLGLRRIANLLNGDNLRTRHGKPWSPTALLNILRNRVYLGNYVRCGMRIVGNHPPIVTPDEFDNAHATLQSRRPSRETATAQEPFLMAGLVHCGTCGNKMAGVSRKRIWTNKDGEQQAQTYRYYECPMRLNGAKHRSLRADFLHAKAIKWLGKLGKRHTSAAQKGYLAAMDSDTNAKNEQIKRELRAGVRAVSNGFIPISEIMPVLKAFQLAEFSQLAENDSPAGANEIDTARVESGTAPVGETKDNFLAVLNGGKWAESGEIAGVKNAFSATLERVDVLDAKKLLFQKRALNQLA